jgi:hypothetical protein
MASPRTPDADVAEANGANLTSRDGLSLAGFEVVALEAAVKVGLPLERGLVESLVECASHLCVSMEPLMLGTPLGQHRLGRRLSLLLSVPLCRRLVEAIPAELFDNQSPLWREETGDPVEREVETLDVVE